MSKIEKRLEELGLQLPNCPVPVASYIPGQIFLDRLVYISGQDCKKDGQLLYEGKLGAEAVSYTHLDVYKRQDMFHPDFLSQRNRC